MSNKQTRFEFVSGDLFNSDCQTITNAVNCVGVMGKGIALEFKKRFPAMFADYSSRCKSKTLHIGTPYVYKSTSTPWILNFPTKNHWRQKSDLADIQTGLDHLASHANLWGLESIAMPALGCGLGGLEWSVVRAEICFRLEWSGLRVVLYEPIGEQS